jgi:hypothetical protein
MQEGSDGREGAGEDHAGSEEQNTRPQQAGEGGTTRLGMEEGDNTDVHATGSPGSEEDVPEESR